MFTGSVRPRKKIWGAKSTLIVFLASIHFINVPATTLEVILNFWKCHIKNVKKWLFDAILKIVGAHLEGPQLSRQWILWPTDGSNVFSSSSSEVKVRKQSAEVAFWPSYGRFNVFSTTLWDVAMCCFRLFWTATMSQIDFAPHSMPLLTCITRGEH